MKALFLFVLALLSAGALAQRNLNIAPTTPGVQRVALVIGNDTYTRVRKLDNARSDARAMARALEQSGFSVTLKLDAPRAGLLDALRLFKAQLNGGSEAVFYFAGHGVQLGAANYLLPTDIIAANEEQVRDDGLPLQRVLDDLTEQKTRFSLVIVDACRDNPFPRNSGSGRSIGTTRGLAPSTAATGQMIIYSAGAGQTALDRLNEADKSPNGLFTRVFLQEMQKPGLPVDRVLRNVRDQVVSLAQKVGHEQVPALYDQAIGEFFFRPAVATVAAPPTPVDTSINDRALWDTVKDSRNPDELRAYLAQFPNGLFAGVARTRIAAMQSASTPAAPAPAASAPAPAVASAPPASTSRPGTPARPAAPARPVPVAVSAPAAVNAPAALPAIPFAAPPAVDLSAAERELWNKVRDSKNPADVQSYLKQYPNGLFAAVAQARLKALETITVASAAPGVAVARPGPAGAPFRDCPECPEMVPLPAGQFTMGTPQGEAFRESDEGPQHAVTIGAFAIGRFEVTVAQWDTCVREGGCNFTPDDGGWGRGNQPIAAISWQDAKQYLAWLSRKTGKRYRLPTEAEWEYAARAGSTSAFSTGTTITPQQANYASNRSYAGAPTAAPHGKPLPVGSFEPNAWGLYDMHGNLREWVEDCYEDTYSGAPANGSARTSTFCFRRVLRGGSWDDPPAFLRSGSRGTFTYDFRAHIFGFRVVRSD